MRATTVAILLLVVTCAVALCRRCAAQERKHVDVALGERVLRDLARQPSSLAWHNSYVTSALEAEGIAFRNVQDQPGVVEMYKRDATIQTPTWRLIVALDRVTEIVCERRFIHQPPPGFVMLDVVFRKGPEDEDGFADELLTVSFDEAQEQEFRRLCERHGLRKIGDF